jgi:hypothetical protein
MIKAVVWVMIAVVTLVATIAAVTESAGVTQFITNLRISMGGG